MATPTSAPGARGIAVRALQWLGVAALACFGLEILTGLLLVVYYRPAASAAYQSVAVINDDVRVGWVIRALHAWTADLLILLGLLHLVRVYFARTYQGAKAATWVTGILAFLIVLGFGFTGTLLPWDQYAYWSIDSSRQTIADIPFLGGTLLNLFWGGWELGEEVLLRFYAFHVGVLPWLGAGLLWLHLNGVARAAGGIGLFERLRRSVSSPAELAVVGLVALSVIVSIAMLFPRPLLAPADPLLPLPDVQPRWYLLPARQLLRHLPGGVAALVVFVMLALLLAVPLLDRREVPSRATEAVRWTLGVSAVVAWLWYALHQYLT